MKILLSKHLLNRSIVLAIFTTTIAACGGGGNSGGDTNTSLGLKANPIPTSQPNPNPTPIAKTNSSAEIATLNLLNENRTKCGFGGLTTNQNLNITASNHANYMATVSTANNIGFADHYEKDEKNTDGVNLLQSGMSNPYYSGYDIQTRLNPKILKEKAIATTYNGKGIENIAEAFNYSNQIIVPVDSIQTSQSMLRTLFAAPYHIRMLLLPQATEVGVSFRQDNWSAINSYYHSGVLEIVSGIPSNSNYVETGNTLTFPCTGVTTDYQLTNETPNPFGYKDASGNIVAIDNPNQLSEARNLETSPVGQPIYIRVPSDKTIKTLTVTIRNGSKTITDVTTLTSATDPNKRLYPYEAIVIPNQPLEPNTTYDVSYQVNMTDNTNVSNTFSFTTIAKI